MSFNTGRPLQPASATIVVPGSQSDEGRCAQKALDRILPHSPLKSWLTVPPSCTKPHTFASLQRPVLLLINSPELPPQLSGLGIQLLHFQPPSGSELLHTLVLTCAAEEQQRRRRQQAQQQRLQEQQGQEGQQGWKGQQGGEGQGSVCKDAAPGASAGISARPGCRLSDLEQLIDACGRDLRACLSAAQFWLCHPSPSSSCSSSSSSAQPPASAAAAVGIRHSGPAVVCCSDAAAPWLLQGPTAPGCGVVHTGCALSQGQLLLQLGFAEASVASCFQGSPPGYAGQGDGGVGRGDQGGTSGTARCEALERLVVPPGGSVLEVMPPWPLDTEQQQQLAPSSVEQAIGQQGADLPTLAGAEQAAGPAQASPPTQPEAGAAARSFDALARQQLLLDYHNASAAVDQVRLTRVAAQLAAWRQATAAAAKAARKSSLGKRGHRSGRAYAPDPEELLEQMAAEADGGVELGVDGLNVAMPGVEEAGGAEEAGVLVGLETEEGSAAGGIEGGDTSAAAVEAVQGVPTTPPTCMGDGAGQDWLSPTAMEGVIDSPADDTADRALRASASAMAAGPVQQEAAKAEADGGVPVAPVAPDAANAGGGSWVLQSLLGPGMRPSLDLQLPQLPHPPSAPPALSYPPGGRTPIALDPNPDLRLLMLLSDAHERLSHAALLSAPRDAAPSCMGVPLPGRCTSQLPHAPLLPGRNVALAWLGGARQPRTQGDAVRDCDGAAAAACYDELVQEELRRGARMPLAACSAGSAGGAAPCGGPSVAQQAGAQVAAALAHAANATCYRSAGQAGAAPPGGKGDTGAAWATGWGTGAAATAPPLLPQPDDVPPRCDYLAWRVPQANNALLAMHQRTATEGVGCAVDRLAAAARMCRLEAARQMEAARLVGRVRRVPRFRHHLLEACPDMPEPLLLTLLQLGSFGSAAAALVGA